MQELLRQAAEEVAELAREGLKNVHVLDFHPALWITPVSLPTGGLDVVTCQDLLYSLRSLEEQAASPHGRETPVADAWLRAVQCAQLAQDRWGRHGKRRGVGVRARAGRLARVPGRHLCTPQTPADSLCLPAPLPSQLTADSSDAVYWAARNE